MSDDGIALPRATSRGLRFREIRPEDQDFLRILYSSTRADEMAQVPWGAEQRAHFLAMQFEAQHAHYMRHFSKADFWLIERDADPVGRLYLDEWDDELRLIDIALMPEHRGQGLGRLVLSDVMEAAAHRGKPVRAHVEKTNPAQRLYARLGYRVIEDKQVYDLLEWHPDWGVHAIEPHPEVWELENRPSN
ncbi:ribosomal protein S18 acetylase RimI-like enzyme [Breoghania corrubedonensis]|uniref:Ribosomal protein S18 acetylase RimI-like enzyme n=1 Tax=Breoghania corrubedonensis TaxID=665038 RepID=A0A2T5V8H8_9HYPH|nr:GNAT family N-acetyltransferase [Breoghania corrubedonensis]PTW60065.1 ribosomal protein S18 acetylase RimI-like enzyme [Breoghania corrubedonensis]